MLEVADLPMTLSMTCEKTRITVPVSWANMISETDGVRRRGSRASTVACRWWRAMLLEQRSIRKSWLRQACCSRWHNECDDNNLKGEGKSSWRFAVSLVRLAVCARIWSAWNEGKFGSATIPGSVQARRCPVRTRVLDVFPTSVASEGALVWLRAAQSGSSTRDFETGGKWYNAHTHINPLRRDKVGCRVEASRGWEGMERFGAVGGNTKIHRWRLSAGSWRFECRKYASNCPRRLW